MAETKVKTWQVVRPTSNGYCDDCRKCDHPVIWEISRRGGMTEWNYVCPRCLKKRGIALPAQNEK